MSACSHSIVPLVAIEDSKCEAATLRNSFALATWSVNDDFDAADRAVLLKAHHSDRLELIRASNQRGFQLASTLL